MLKRLCVTYLAVFAVACAPRVDGSTLATCKTSLDAVVAKASRSSDSARFKLAMMELRIGELQTLTNTLGDALTSGRTTSRKAVPEPALDSAATQATLCAAVNKLSAAKIMERAGTLGGAIKDSLDNQRAHAYLAALRAAHARATVARDSISAFRVVKAAFTQRDGTVGLETAITLTVENGTKHAVSGGFFSAVATTPGAAAPWLDQEFNYTVRGGIARGATATWRIVANRLTPAWGDVLIPREAQIVVTPIKLFSASGEQLWGGAEFTKADQAEMDRLAAKYK